MDKKEQLSIAGQNEVFVAPTPELYVMDGLPEPPQELPHDNPIHTEAPEPISYDAFFRTNWSIVVNRTMRAGIDEPEDVASLTFFAVWQRWNKLDTTPPGPVGYLKTVNKTRIIDYYRHKNVVKEEPRTLDEDSLPGALLLSEAANSTDSVVDLDVLARVRARLDPDQQALFSLLAQNTLAHHTPTADIAREAGTPSITIRTRIFRLRQILRALLAEEGYHYD